MARADRVHSTPPTNTPSETKIPAADSPSGAPMVGAPTRRTIMNMILGAAVLTSATAVKPVEAAQQHPDAELIALAKEMAELRKRLDVAQEYEEAEEAIAEQMNKIYSRIGALEATTLEGFRAQATAFVLHEWCGEIKASEEEYDEGERMVARMMSSLTGIPISPES
jgi:hypothetical protein